MKNYPDSAFQSNIIAAEFAGRDNLFAQHLLIWNARDFMTCEGVNEGDTLSIVEDLVPGDSYALTAEATAKRLGLYVKTGLCCEIAAGSETGTPGADLYLDGTITLMSAAGKITRGVILVEVDATRHISNIYIAATGRVQTDTPYCLISIDSGPGTQAEFDMLTGRNKNALPVPSATHVQRPSGIHAARA